MPDWVSDWLDRLSAGQLALVFCVHFVGITWLGILLVHPLMRRLLHRNRPSNELIIHIAGTFGLFYAVLLGLLTVATFQNTKDLPATRRTPRLPLRAALAGKAAS
jgi:hypothetical protein